MCVCVWWGGGGGMGESDLRPPSPVICKARSSQITPAIRV